MGPLLRIESLHVAYGEIVALRGVSLEVRAGEAVALVGANGAGKTTLMKAITGLLRARSGQLAFEDAPIADLPTHRRARLGIGYAPEGRRVFPGLSVRDNLEVASRAGPRETAARIDKVLTLFPGLAPKIRALGWTLSGGQQQMVAIGRALMDRPRLLLLDEPSLGLSPRLADEVLDRIPAIVTEGCAVLIAEQNLSRALEVADRAYVLRTGMIIQTGASSALRTDPGIRDAFLGGA